jgi:hypothetical protein
VREMMNISDTSLLVNLLHVFVSVLAFIFQPLNLLSPPGINVFERTTNAPMNQRRNHNHFSINLRGDNHHAL